MVYKIVEDFGPKDGDKWLKYIGWRGLKLTRFDSVDSIMRPDLFTPTTDDDWKNCVNEDFKLNMITNLDYAKKCLKRYEDAVLIGVEDGLTKEYQESEGLVGFDIIDGHCSISLLTNWGTDEDDYFNHLIMPNGLISDLKDSLKVCHQLRKKFSNDPHAKNSEVWAIYQVDL